MKNFRAIGRFSAAAAAVALLAASAVPAVAATSDPTSDSAKQERKEPKASQKYCVNEAVTGSRVPTKVCKTRSEWIQEEGFDPINQR